MKLSVRDSNGIHNQVMAGSKKALNHKLLVRRQNEFSRQSQFNFESSATLSDVSVCETNRGTWLKEGFGSSFNLRSEDEIEI